MAVLTNADYKQIQRIIRNDPASNSEFKAWGIDKQTWMDLFQAAEDWFVNGFSSTPSSSFKGALDIVYSGITNAQTKQIAFAWMGWRFRNSI